MPAVAELDVTAPVDATRDADNVPTTSTLVVLVGMRSAVAPPVLSRLTS